MGMTAVRKPAGKFFLQKRSDLFMENLDAIKDQICDVCHKMWQLGWVAANDGNVPSV